MTNNFQIRRGLRRDAVDAAGAGSVGRSRGGMCESSMVNAAWCTVPPNGQVRVGEWRQPAAEVDALRSALDEAIEF